MASILLNTDNTGLVTRDILPLVKAALGYPPSDPTKDTMLCYLAELAMEQYNQIAPRVQRATLTTVANQLSYSLPADCRLVSEVAVPSEFGYYNDFLFLPMIDTPSSSLFGFSDYAFRSPSERIIRQGILTELDHYAQSFTGWYQDGAPPKLFILPVATSGGASITVRYLADHLNSNASDPVNPTWTTLPAGHWKYVIRLVKWAMSDQRADVVASSMTLSENSGGNAALTESWKNGNRAERILQEVRMALGADATVGVRS